MKFSADISKILAAIQPFAGKKRPLPFDGRGAILVEASSDSVTASATDLDVFASVKMAAEVGTQGRVCLPADVARIAKDVCDVSVDEKRHATIKHGRTRAKLLGLSADEHPTAPAVDVELDVVDSAVFFSLIQRVAYAASTDETRHNLCGVRLIKIDDLLHAVATDGHRLSLSSLRCDVKVKQPVTVGTAGITRAAKFFVGDVGIGFSDSFARFEAEDRSLSVRLVDGVYPDYRQVIPGDDKADTVVIVEREHLHKALRSAAAISNDRQDAVRITPSGSTVALAVINPDAGEIVTEVDAACTGTQAVAINARYLDEAIAHLSGALTIRITNGGLGPVRIDEAGRLTQSVIMPMRL